MSEEAQQIEQAEVEKKPKRTSNRKPKAQATESAEQDAAAKPAKKTAAKAKAPAKSKAKAESADQVAAKPADQVAAKPEGEETPKPRRGRKPKADKESAPAEVPAAPVAAEASAAPATESAPKPRGRRPKAQAPKEEPMRALTEDEVVALLAAGPEAAARMMDQVAAKPEKTPKATRAKSSKAQSAKKSEATEAPATAEATAESAPAPEATVAPAADPTAMYPKRRRARVEAPSDEAASETSEAPHRRPRRSVKAEGGAAAFAAEGEASADATAAVVAALVDAVSQEAAVSENGESESAALAATDSAASAVLAADQAESQAAGQNNAKGKKQNDRDRNDRERNDHDRGGRNDRNDRNDRSRNDRNGRNDRNDRNHNRNKRDRNREIEPSVTREGLAELKVAELRAKATELELDAAGMKKAELVEAVYEATVKAEGFLEVSGVLDILADGYGFVRTQGYLPSEHDCYVGLSLVKRNGLRKGDYIVGQTRPARANEKYAAIQKVISVNGIPIEQLGHRIRFSDLTPVYPQERLRMEHGKNTTTARVIDLVAPIGKGQRGLIVSPPKAGKTTILKDIAASIAANNPEVHLMCLLVDERPEEVTDMERSIKGEVISSTFDMPADNHIACAEMVIERAKRLVENGEDVVILLDSITRLARAYNLAQPASGRVLSGGVDSTALYPPKKFLGAARNIENGGSLTILASALIDTGSKMDEVIFEEFKGTGNMELKLDRNLADRRIFPAIDAVASGTRKEELLMDTQVAPLIWAVRRILANMNNTERATDTLIKSIKQTENNEEFLVRMARKAQQSSKMDSLDL